MIVRNLTYQHHKQAPYFFQNLSFELEEGRIHALHGKNGVGKSVLLHILSRNIEPEAVISGEIEGKAVLMSQQFDQTLVGSFTFLENLQLAALGQYPSVFSCLNKFTLPLHYRLLLERFHIDVRIPVNKLSGGQRQILALIMKLERKPKILLLDEPTATLDEQNAIMVFEFLKALQGITLLIVCHDHELIHTYANKHFTMEADAAGQRRIREALPAFSSKRSQLFSEHSIPS